MRKKIIFLIKPVNLKTLYHKYYKKPAKTCNLKFFSNRRNKAHGKP